MAGRPFIVSLGWTLRDYAKRVWDNSGEDNVLFLAGGVTFNLLLAALPFILLLAAGVTWLLPLLVRGQQQADSLTTVTEVITRMLPEHSAEPGSPINKAIKEALGARGS